MKFPVKNNSLHFIEWKNTTTTAKQTRYKQKRILIENHGLVISIQDHFYHNNDMHSAALVSFWVNKIAILV